MEADQAGRPCGSPLTEGFGPLRELATEGAALHSPGQPERVICDGLLAALDEVERLRGIVPEVLERLNDELCAENDRLRGVVAEWDKLRDPHTLHVNLLRGFPARLARPVLLHLAGDEEPKW